MSAEYSHQVLKVCVAQLCQNLGWNSTQSTPLELLTDVLERYILEVGKVTHRYAEQCMWYLCMFGCCSYPTLCGLSNISVINMTIKKNQTLCKTL
jgi:hypothetical protein